MSNKLSWTQPEAISRLRVHEGVRASESNLLGEFPQEREISSYFHAIWGRIEENLDLPLTSDEALRKFKSLVIYDMPDGTRSTLSVNADIDVGVDAALYCVALIHTLKSLGSKRCVIMTHTSYNRGRGAEGIGRIFKLVSSGTKLMARYAEAERIGINMLGLREEYEMREHLGNLPSVPKSAFDVFFLVDYAEELFDDPRIRAGFETLPEVDVCVRHTKLNMSGGWIPTKLLNSTFMYCQNGTLLSNWDFEELTALASLALLAKVMHRGEGLVKMYGDIDEVKARYQLRELRLFNEQVYLRENPTKLFFVGSPHGMYQFYF